MAEEITNDASVDYADEANCLMETQPLQITSTTLIPTHILRHIKLSDRFFHFTGRKYI